MFEHSDLEVETLFETNYADLLTLIAITHRGLDFNSESSNQKLFNFT